MTALTRQNSLFVAEDWVRIYEALENVDFRSYDFDNLVQALMQYLRSNYPEEFNDWIASSEFVTKIEILAWLSQNIAFRVDLNTRENFLATAERRDSLIRLAQNIGYKINRARSASGQVKLKTIRTDQPIIDSNGINLQNRTITWNDPRDEDWFERFVLVLNAAFAERTQFGSPLNRFTLEGVRSDQYVFNSTMPTSNTYRFAANVNGINNPFDIYNARLNPENGLVEEISPDSNNTFNILYRIDGRGFGSSSTGFFLPIVQGNLSSQDEVFTTPEVLRTVTLSATNVNNDDFFVQEIDGQGGVISTWTQIDTSFGEGVSFNTQAGTVQNVYEIETLTNDKVRIRFGDGSFGRIPLGRFRFWFRTANPTPAQVRPSSVQNQLLSIPYAGDNSLFTLTMGYSLEDVITNGSRSETNFDIRSRAGKVFYTQNRMVTAQDYNNFFLKDNSIQKVKTVNRTFSGQSRYARLNDPTGLYQNVRHTAEDGRLYQDTTTTVNQFSANTAVISSEALLNTSIKPLIRKADKQVLYFNQYGEVIFPNVYTWNETARIGGGSRGNITFSGSAQTVGNAGTGNLAFVNNDAILRFGGPKGIVASVDRIIEDGDAANGIILRDEIDTGTNVFSVFPDLRNNFTLDEENTIELRLNQKLDFAIAWDQSEEAWVIIESSDINKSGAFNLDHQGDKTSAALDQSWMILLEFLPNDAEDLWRITDRGESMFFESAREIDFVFSNNDATIDPETGRSVRDTVVLSQSNESRDSMRRRGLEDLGDGFCEGSATVLRGDGVTTRFPTLEVPLLPETTVVIVDDEFQIFGVDFTIEANPRGHIIVFTTAPASGVEIAIRTSSRFRNVTQSVAPFVADGSADEYDLFVKKVNGTNVISFLDGVMQSSSLDFGIGSLAQNASIVYNEIVPTGVVGTVFVMSGVDNEVLTKSNLIGDGSRTEFTIPTFNQTEDTIMVAIDGIVQAPSTYYVTQSVDGSVVNIGTPPADGTRLRIISINSPVRTLSHMYEFEANGSTNLFALDRTPLVPREGHGIMIFIDGVQQDGPWASSPCWSVTGTNQIIFTTSPPAGTTIQMFTISGSVGILCDPELEGDVATVNNRGPLNVESCLVNFLGSDVTFTPAGVIRHADGYVNKNGLRVAPIDNNVDGNADQPFVFKDLVLQNGFTDLVLWRRIQEFGFNVLDPIGETTVPRGTYGASISGAVAVGDPIDSDVSAVGDIHLDTSTGSWLVADLETREWITAPDQSAFQSRIGRSNLKFTWTHFAPEANRIDPSKSNAMNVFVLTAGFDAAYRLWLTQNGRPEDEPIPETSEQLRIQYAEFEQFKMLSDAIIFYPSRYKPLFGDQAVTELQSTFKIIQTPGSTVSESDLKLRVLAVIEDYFRVDRWNFGDQFFFTELVAFVHSQLAPDLQSMVVVPRNNAQSFGRLFQVRAEPDELFVSSASPDDIEVVKFFTDDELRIGTLV